MSFGFKEFEEGLADACARPLLRSGHGGQKRLSSAGRDAEEMGSGRMQATAQVAQRQALDRREGNNRRGKRPGRSSAKGLCFEIVSSGGWQVAI